MPFQGEGIESVVQRRSLLKGEGHGQGVDHFDGGTEGVVETLAGADHAAGRVDNP